MARRLDLGPVERQVDEVVHTLHCRYPLFATLRILRTVIATATLSILTRFSLMPLAVRVPGGVRRRIVFKSV